MRDICRREQRVQNSVTETVGGGGRCKGGEVDDDTGQLRPAYRGKIIGIVNRRRRHYCMLYRSLWLNLRIGRDKNKLQTG
jgi:hypothetical protein